MDIDLENHEIIKTYIPFVVKEVLSKEEAPKDEDQLVEFCQELGKQIIKRIEPMKMN